MKIAMIAMSGIRAENPELMELGLTLPGFLDRARSLFAMPSLSLLTLAGMTPRDIEIEYREYREFPADAPPECDLAVIRGKVCSVRVRWGCWVQPVVHEAHRRVDRDLQRVVP